MSRSRHLANTRKDALVREAKELGFAEIGVAQAGFLEEEAPRLEEWLKRGYQGEMGYLERNADKRLDPRLLVPGAKTVVSLLFNYHVDEEETDADTPRIASYARGQDYHHVLKWKLKELMKWAQASWGGRERPSLRGFGTRSRASLGGTEWLGLGWKKQLAFKPADGELFLHCGVDH